MNKKAFLINSTFFLAIALSIIFIKQFMDNSTSDSKKNDDHSPDAYMMNAFYLRTNEKGLRDVILFAPEVTHYKFQDSSEFKNPQITVFKNGDEWHITSKKAKGVQGASTFYFYDNVRVHQLPNKYNAGSVLLTQSLTVFPKKNLVTTRDFVTIEQPGVKINAVGLKGDLDSGNITLLSKTRSQYDPKQHDKTVNLTH